MLRPSFIITSESFLGSHMKTGDVSPGQMKRRPSEAIMLEEIARTCSDTRIRPSVTLVLTGPNGQIGGLGVTAFAR